MMDLLDGIFSKKKETVRIRTAKAVPLKKDPEKKQFILNNNRSQTPQSNASIFGSLRRGQGGVATSTPKSTPTTAKINDVRKTKVSVQPRTRPPDKEKKPWFWTNNNVIKKDPIKSSTASLNVNSVQKSTIAADSKKKRPISNATLGANITFRRGQNQKIEGQNLPDNLSRTSSITNLDVEQKNNKGAKPRKAASRDRIDKIGDHKKNEKKGVTKNNNKLESNDSPYPSIDSLQEEEFLQLRRQLQEMAQEKSNLALQLGEQKGQLNMLQKEIQTLKEESNIQLEHLTEENTLLRNRLKDVAHSPLSDNEKQQLLYETHRHHSSAPASIATNLIDEGNGGDITACPTPDWDKHSSSNISEVSVACLQDKINQMQETHYSTNEELQATLQELTDLQRQLTELQQENERLNEEKTLMFDSLCRQTERLNDSRSEVESLKQLLYREKDETGQYESAVEREQKLVDLLKSAQEEREALLVKLEHVNNEMQEAKAALAEKDERITHLSERVRTLECTVDAKHAEHKQLDQELAQAKDQCSGKQIEINRLTDLLDNARTKISELEQDRALSDKSELDELLDNARKEKDALESEVAHLKEQLAISKNETEKLKEQVSILQEECKVTRNNAKTTQCDLEYKCEKLVLEKNALNNQLQEFQEAINELQVQSQCQLEDKRQLSAVLSETQRNLSEAERKNLNLESEVQELKRLREEENEEWEKFQNDLLTSVRVANDFKTEAQQELQRMIMENKSYRERERQLKAELDKLKGKSAKREVSTTNSSGRSKSSDKENIPTKEMEGLLKLSRRNKDKSTRGSKESLDVVSDKSKDKKSEPLKTVKKRERPRTALRKRKTLSVEEEILLKSLDDWYEHIDKNIPEENLTEEDKVIKKLKTLYEDDSLKQRPVAPKPKDQLAISKPLLDSVFLNPKLESIAKDPNILTIKEMRNSSIINSENEVPELRNSPERNARPSHTKSEIFGPMESKRKSIISRSKSYDDINSFDDRKGTAILYRCKETDDLRKESPLKRSTRPSTILPTDSASNPRYSDYAIIVNQETTETELQNNEVPKVPSVNFETLDRILAFIPKNIPEHELSSEQQLALRLKRALDEAERKNTLKKMQKTKNVYISPPTIESVQKNSRLRDILLDPDIKSVQRRNSETDTKNVAFSRADTLRQSKSYQDISFTFQLDPNKTETCVVVEDNCTLELNVSLTKDSEVNVKMDLTQPLEEPKYLVEDTVDPVEDTDKKYDSLEYNETLQKIQKSNKKNRVSKYREHIFDDKPPVRYLEEDLHFATFEDNDLLYNETLRKRLELDQIACDQEDQRKRDAAQIYDVEYSHIKNKAPFLHEKEDNLIEDDYFAYGRFQKAKIFHLGFTEHLSSSVIHRRIDSPEEDIMEDKVVELKYVDLPKPRENTDIELTEPKERTVTDEPNVALEHTSKKPEPLKGSRVFPHEKEERVVEDDYFGCGRFQEGKISQLGVTEYLSSSAICCRMDSPEEDIMEEKLVEPKLEYIDVPKPRVSTGTNEPNFVLEHTSKKPEPLKRSRVLPKEDEEIFSAAKTLESILLEKPKILKQSRNSVPLKIEEKVNKRDEMVSIVDKSKVTARVIDQPILVLERNMNDVAKEATDINNANKIEKISVAPNLHMEKTHVNNDFEESKCEIVKLFQQGDKSTKDKEETDEFQELSDVLDEFEKRISYLRGKDISVDETNPCEITEITSEEINSSKTQSGDYIDYNIREVNNDPDFIIEMQATPGDYISEDKQGICETIFESDHDNSQGLVTEDFTKEHDRSADAISGLKHYKNVILNTVEDDEATEDKGEYDYHSILKENRFGVVSPLNIRLVYKDVVKEIKYKFPQDEESSVIKEEEEDDVDEQNETFFDEFFGVKRKVTESKNLTEPQVSTSVDEIDKEMEEIFEKYLHTPLAKVITQIEEREEDKVKVDKCLKELDSDVNNEEKNNEHDSVGVTLVNKDYTSPRNSSQDLNQSEAEEDKLVKNGRTLNQIELILDDEEIVETKVIPSSFMNQQEDNIPSQSCVSENLDDNNILSCSLDKELVLTEKITSEKQVPNIIESINKNVIYNTPDKMDLVEPKILNTDIEEHLTPEELNLVRLVQNVRYSRPLSDFNEKDLEMIQEISLHYVPEMHDNEPEEFLNLVSNERKEIYPDHNITELQANFKTGIDENEVKLEISNDISILEPTETIYYVIESEEQEISRADRNKISDNDDKTNQAPCKEQIGSSSTKKDEDHNKINEGEPDLYTILAKYLPPKFIPPQEDTRIDQHKETEPAEMQKPKAKLRHKPIQREVCDRKEYESQFLAAADLVEAEKRDEVEKSNEGEHDLEKDLTKLKDLTSYVDSEDLNDERVLTEQKMQMLIEIKQSEHISIGRGENDPFKNVTPVTSYEEIKENEGVIIEKLEQQIEKLQGHDIETSVNEAQEIIDNVEDCIEKDKIETKKHILNLKKDKEHNVYSVDFTDVRYDLAKVEELRPPVEVSVEPIEKEPRGQEKFEIMEHNSFDEPLVLPVKEIQMPQPSILNSKLEISGLPDSNRNSGSQKLVDHDNSFKSTGSTVDQSLIHPDNKREENLRRERQGDRDIDRILARMAASRSSASINSRHTTDIQTRISGFSKEEQLKMKKTNPINPNAYLRKTGYEGVKSKLDYFSKNVEAAAVKRQSYNASSNRPDPDRRKVKSCAEIFERRTFDSFPTYEPIYANIRAVSPSTNSKPIVAPKAEKKPLPIPRSKNPGSQVPVENSDTVKTVQNDKSIKDSNMSECKIISENDPDNVPQEVPNSEFANVGVLDIPVYYAASKIVIDRPKRHEPEKNEVEKQKNKEMQEQQNDEGAGIDKSEKFLERMHGINEENMASGAENSYSSIAVAGKFEQLDITKHNDDVEETDVNNDSNLNLFHLETSSYDESYLNLFKSPEDKVYDDISGLKRPQKGYFNIAYLGEVSDNESYEEFGENKLEHPKKLKKTESKPKIIDFVPLDDATKPVFKKDNLKEPNYDTLEREKTFHVLNTAATSAKASKSTTDIDDSSSSNRSGSRTSFSAAKKVFEALLEANMDKKTDDKAKKKC